MGCFWLYLGYIKVGCLVFDKVIMFHKTLFLGSFILMFIVGLGNVGKKIKLRLLLVVQGQLSNHLVLVMRPIPQRLCHHSRLGQGLLEWSLAVLLCKTFYAFL